MLEVNIGVVPRQHPGIMSPSAAGPEAGAGFVSGGVERSRLMRNFQIRRLEQHRSSRLSMLAFTLAGLTMSLVGGCAGQGSTSTAAQSEVVRQFSPPPLVLASTATLEVLGHGGLVSSEMHLFNSRKDFSLGRIFLLHLHQ